LIVDTKTGFLVEPGRPELLAAALELVVTDPDRARALGAAGRERARAHFSRERMVADVSALYDELLSG
jgi:glycosyltransferase involved in cell wall biosynthesis